MKDPTPKIAMTARRILEALRANMGGLKWAEVVAEAGASEPTARRAMGWMREDLLAPISFHRTTPQVWLLDDPGWDLPGIRIGRSSFEFQRTTVTSVNEARARRRRLGLLRYTMPTGNRFKGHVLTVEIAANRAGISVAQLLEGEGRPRRMARFACWRAMAEFGVSEDEIAEMFRVGKMEARRGIAAASADKMTRRLSTEIMRGARPPVSVRGEEVHGEEIGRQMGVTREMIRQISNKGLAKMKKHLTKQGARNAWV